MSTKFDIPGALDTFDDVAGWIAAPPAGRPMAEAIGKSGQQACDAWSAMPPWLESSLKLDGTGSALIGRKLMDLVCKPYLDGGGFDPPQLLPPFTGGQCQIPYNVTLQSSNAPGSPLGGSIVVAGPILSAERKTQPSGNPSLPLLVYAEVTTAADGTQRNSGFNTSAASLPSVSLWITTVSGQPDNCGDPPPTDFAPGANPAPSPVRPPIGEEPGFNPDGQPFFYVPDFPGDGGEDQPILPFDDDGDGGGGQPPSEPTPGDESEGEGSGQGGGDNDFGDPPEGQRWVGCEVTLTAVPSGTGIIPQSLPRDIYTATQGNARLKFASSALVGYDTPIAIKSKSVWVWEPVRGASPSGVFVNVRPGIAYTVRPYSVPLEN